MPRLSYEPLELKPEGFRYSVMQLKPDMEAIFPIKDAASAALMAIKADHLHRAGVIAKLEERWVHSKACTFLNNDTPVSGFVAVGRSPVESP
jgi:hypothetical protein